MKTLLLDAFIPSKEEYQKYKYKFPAFMKPKLSKNKNWFNVDPQNKQINGWFILRSSSKKSHELLICSGDEIREFNYTNHSRYTVGLRIAFKLKYNPNSSIFKSIQYKSSSIYIYEEKTNKEKKIINTAPILTFGKHECIWLNKEECENELNDIMDLWTLDLVDNVFYYDFEEQHIDSFEKAKDLIQACNNILKQNCSQEELDMLLKVKLNKKDDFEHAFLV